MYKFISEPDVDNPHDRVKITVETDEVMLTELLATFEAFLRASGFSFEGSVEIVESGDE